MSVCIFFYMQGSVYVLPFLYLSIYLSVQGTVCLSICEYSIFYLSTSICKHLYIVSSILHLPVFIYPIYLSLSICTKVCLCLLRVQATVYCLGIFKSLNGTSNIDLSLYKSSYLSLSLSSLFSFYLSLSSSSLYHLCVC